MNTTHSGRSVAALSTFLILGAAGCGASGDGDRMREVAEVGTAVMTFDLERTTHVFERVETGGVQTVLSDDGDGEQVRLIRAHLAEEAERFAHGDFHDPSMIHGSDMAGLHMLVEGHEELTITYRDVERGGVIDYRSDDPQLVEGIHLWFDAQLRDHGEHAQGDMEGHDER